MRSRATVVVVAVVLFVLVFLTRQMVDDPSSALGVLYAVPVGLLAAYFGRRVGVAAALVGITVLVAQSFTEPTHPGLLGYVTRGLVVLLVGWCLGWYSDRLRSVQGVERHRFATAADALVDVDREGRILAVNPAAESLFGYTERELVGELVDVLVPEDSRESHRQSREAYLAEPSIRTVGRSLSARRRDGTTVPVHISLDPRQSARGLVVRAELRDVSELQRALAHVGESEDRYRTLMEYAPEAVVVLDVDEGTFFQANPQAARLFELSREELLRRGPAEMSPPHQPDGRTSAEASAGYIGEAVQGGLPVFEWVHRTATGRDVPCEVRLARLPHSTRVLVRGSVTDISERKRAERERTRAAADRQVAARARHLNRITEAALVHMTVDEMLPELLTRLREALAVDSAVVLLADEQGMLSVRACIGAHDDEGRVVVGQGFAGRVVSERRPVAVSADELVGMSDPCTGNLRSLVGVPLLGNSETVGVLQIGSKSERTFTTEDVSLLELAANRATLVIERAAVYEREHDTARALQQSLLPRQLPRIPGVALAARYRPAVYDVGGDFYDVFRIGSSQWFAVVGDVCGKGPAAAALTALARYTLRAEARHTSSPAEMLRSLNATLFEREEEAGILTAACVLLDLEDTVTASVASGGHPLPVHVSRSGEVVSVGETGLLLGAVPHLSHREVSVALTPGDSLLCYTDGLLDAHAPHRSLDPEDLVPVLSKSGNGSLDDMLARLEVEASGDLGEGWRDDVAMLALRVEAPGVSEVTGRHDRSTGSRKADVSARVS